MKCHQECSSRKGSPFLKQLKELGFPTQTQRTSSVMSTELFTCFSPKPASSSLPRKQKSWYQENFLCFIRHSSSQASASKDNPGNSHMGVPHDQTPEHTVQNNKSLTFQEFGAMETQFGQQQGLQPLTWQWSAAAQSQEVMNPAGTGSSHFHCHIQQDRSERQSDT